jgi:hypothetical protein
MQRVIAVGSALTHFVFAGALVVLLNPNPGAPAAPGSRYYVCIPPNVIEGQLLAFLAAALSALIALAAVYHSLIARRYGCAALIGFGLLAVLRLISP